MLYKSQIKFSLDKLAEFITLRLSFGKVKCSVNTIFKKEKMSIHDPKSKSPEPKSQELDKKKSSKSSLKNSKSKSNISLSKNSNQKHVVEVEQKSHKIVDRTAKPIQNNLPIKEKNNSEASSISSVLSTEDAEGRISSEKTNHTSIEKLSKTLNSDAAAEEIPSFKPPRNFIKKEVQESPSVSSLFNESNLEGKQIWYFTMPSTLDISSLESVSSSTIISEEPVFKKNGDEYIFTKDLSDTQNYKIIVPVATKNGYKVVSKHVSQVLNLQQIVEETKLKKSKTNTGNSIITVSESEIKKEQPNGLKMRFHPLGFFDEPPEKIGDNSSEQSSNEEGDSETKSTNLPTQKSCPKKHKKSEIAPKNSSELVHTVKHSNGISRQRFPEERSHSHKRKHEH